MECCLIQPDQAVCFFFKLLFWVCVQDSLYCEQQPDVHARLNFYNIFWAFDNCRLTGFFALWPVGWIKMLFQAKWNGAKPEIRGVSLCFLVWIATKIKQMRKGDLSLQQSGNALEERSPTEPDGLLFSRIKHGKQIKEVDLVSQIVKHLWDNDRQMEGGLAHRFRPFFDAMFWSCKHMMKE